MKEAIGGLGITQIVIIFLLLFAAYISVSVNMSKAQKVKDEVISIIQKNNGLNSSAKAQITSYMSSIGYRSTGSCDNGWSGGGGTVGNLNGNGNLYCYKEVGLDAYSSEDAQFPRSAYYEVKVFFALDIPVLNNVFKFNLTGSTRRLYSPSTE